MTDPNEYREQPVFPSQESDQTMIKSNLQELAASLSDECMLAGQKNSGMTGFFPTRPLSNR